MKESTRNMLITLFVSVVSAFTTAYLIKDEEANSIDYAMLYLLTWLVVFTCLKFVMLAEEREK